MKLCVLGSGSQGNSIVVSSGETTLMVDIGFTCKQIVSRMASSGLDPEDVSAVLFTHDHSDHFKGVKTFHKKYPDASLFANGNTADSIASQTGVEDWTIFETAEDFQIGDFSVSPFSISHDAADPVGYFLHDGANSLFIGTDMGVVTFPVKDAFLRADIAILESNHDPELLMMSDRAYSLKQRISGRSGHLANRDAANLFRETNPANLKALFLAHLSSECNRPHLAMEEMLEAIREHNREDINLHVLEQDVPSMIFEF